VAGEGAGELSGGGGRGGGGGSGGRDESAHTFAIGVRELVDMQDAEFQNASAGGEEPIGRGRGEGRGEAGGERERAREEGDRVWEGKIERIQTEGLRVEWTSAFQV
jgi:hypothetical protein